MSAVNKFEINGQTVEIDDTKLTELLPDVIFDISEYNKVDNELKIYADLIDALADVPSDMQYGGMTVRYVQTSDNKYVQYRLVADEWSVKQNDWRNYDDGPITEELKSAVNLTEEDLTRINSGVNGFITSTGDLNTSVTNAFFTKYKVKYGYGIKAIANAPDAPRNDAKLWAIYSSDTVFDSTTCIAISDVNAKSETTEVFTVPANAKVLIFQRFYSGSNTVKLLQNTATKTADDVSELSEDVAKKKRSNVFLQSAIVNTSLSESIKNKYLDGIVSLKIKGISITDKYIVSKFNIGTYDGNYIITITISKIENNTLSEIINFYESFSSIPSDGSVKYIKVATNYSADVYYAECIVDLSKIGTDLFNNVVSSVDTDTYKNFGINPNCIENEGFESALPSGAINRLRRAIRKIEIRDLDYTRTYLLTRFAYEPNNNGYLHFSICTTENFLDTYIISKPIGTSHSGIETLFFSNIRITLDFDVLNNNTLRYAYTTDSIPSEETNKLTIFGFENNTRLIAEEELTLTYNGEPVKLLTYGDISKKFYLSCGRKLLATSSITKQTYTEADINGSLELSYEFQEESIATNTFIVGINTVRELNNGQMIVNVAVNNYSDSNLTDYSTYSSFYRWDGNSMTKLFDGTWSYHTHSSGATMHGGFWTGIWDFDNYDNLVFISERCNQGRGGRAWMSKDGGLTWYVIFNAFTFTNYDLYKVVQPSGWDPDNNDFQRPVPGTSSYPYSNFHIHGIAYDRWHDNVIIVTGDASSVKGSYTAVWVLHNPEACTVYPATGDIPEGATSVNNPVKMLECTWRRVGLYNDENPIGKNLQFVNTLPFEDFTLFGSDCGGGGINGIIMNSYPKNIVSSNFIVKYPLNADDDNAITHCSSGILKLKNGPYLWTFHREGSGFSLTSSDQKAAILSSYDGVTWKRAWDDDTFNYDGERGTKVMWGATMIGNSDELYLRYKGFNLTDNVIRRMVLRV